MCLIVASPFVPHESNMLNFKSHYIYRIGIAGLVILNLQHIVTNRFPATVIQNPFF